MFIFSFATWVIMISPETGEPYPEYWEPEIVISPYPKSKFLSRKVVILPAGFESEDDWGKKKIK